MGGWRDKRMGKRKEERKGGRKEGKQVGGWSVTYMCVLKVYFN